MFPKTFWKTRLRWKKQHPQESYVNGSIWLLRQVLCAVTLLRYRASVLREVEGEHEGSGMLTTNK